MEPHSLVGERGRWFCQAWPAASKTNVHGPPTSSGGRERWFVDGRKKVGTEWFFLPFFKGYRRPQPAQPVGGPLRTFHCEGRRPGIL